jgi:hypothetical protein
MIAAVVLLALANASAAPTIKNSVGILYHQAEDGGMVMVCTVTKTERGWLTAAHCVTEVGADTKDRVRVEVPWFISMDERDAKSYVRAELKEVGRREKGYDYALLDAQITAPELPLGDETKERDSAPVINVAAPAGIGRVAFFGNIALRFIDRPLLDEETKINWAGGMLIQVPVEGGSSGSAIVSADTGKIIGIMVGHVRSLSIALPISRAKNPPKEYILFPAQKETSAK